MVPTRRLRSAPTATQAAPATAPASRLWRKDTNGVALITVMVWLLLFIMIIPQGLDYAGINGMPASSDAISRIAWLVILGGALYVVASRKVRAVKLVKFLNPFLLAFLALALASYSWSIEPAITLRRVVRALSIVLACYAFVLVGWHQYRFQTLIRTILTTMMIISIVMVVTMPDLA